MGFHGMIFYINIEFISVKSNDINIPLLEVTDRSKIVTVFNQALEI